MNKGKNDVTQKNVTHSKHSENTEHSDVTQKNVTHSEICNTILNIRMPQSLKEEIKRQANDLGMTASALAKVVLFQQFIKR